MNEKDVFLISLSMGTVLFFVAVLFVGYRQQQRDRKEQQKHPK